MKVILSRKGFDSASGGGPSPILPDGTLLSLPIPEAGGTPYGDLDAGRWGSYADVMSRLGMTVPTGAHLDPDLIKSIQPRTTGWRPAFGQAGAAQRHLAGQRVSAGDLFLFFGLFRATELHDGRLRWVPGSKPRHVIWGYLQIDAVHDLLMESARDQLSWAATHPHLRDRDRKFNTLYVARDHLTFVDAPGAGALTHSSVSTLTGEGESPSFWVLPSAFAPTGARSLSFHSDPARWSADKSGQVAVRSVGRGQEFVIDAGGSILRWAADVIQAGIAIEEPAEPSTDKMEPRAGVAEW